MSRHERCGTAGVVKVRERERERVKETGREFTFKREREVKKEIGRAM